MQIYFAEKTLKELSAKEKLQTLVTTHSSHVVSRCDFSFIRFLQCCEDDKKVIAKNFRTDLSSKYADQDDFNFLKKYITLNAAELFFASKVIFIEGNNRKNVVAIFY